MKSIAQCSRDETENLGFSSDDFSHLRIDAQLERDELLSIRNINLKVGNRGYTIAKDRIEKSQIPNILLEFLGSFPLTLTIDFNH